MKKLTNDIEKAIDALKMDNALMEFDPSTGDERPIKSQNELNQCVYKANLLAISALEKQIPKKTKYKTTCPVCNTYNSVWNKRANTKPWDIVYCWHCGNAIKLDWSKGVL